MGQFAMRYFCKKEKVNTQTARFQHVSRNLTVRAVLCNCGIQDR